MLALRRYLDPFAFGVVPAVFTLGLLATFAASGVFAIDFHNAFWPAGQAVLHGAGPYVSPDDPSVAAATAFVYPAPAALLLTPFALLPLDVGSWVFTILGMLAVPATLLVLRVTDWRLYGLVLLWLPVLTSWQAANLTTLLGLGIAVAWRLRARPVGVGVAVGLLVAVKLFLWPLVIWLLATRRYRAAAWSVGAGVLVNVVAWSVLGWSELPRYLDLMQALSSAMASKAYSLATLGALGVVAEVVLVGVLVLVGARGDRQALTAAIAGALLLSPLIWTHYFALLVVPIALAHPRYHFAWALPLLMWAVMPPGNDPAIWQLGAVLLVSAVTVAVCIRRRGAVLVPERTKARSMAGLRERLSYL